MVGRQYHMSGESGLLSFYALLYLRQSDARFARFDTWKFLDKHEHSQLAQVPPNLIFVCIMSVDSCCTLNVPFPGFHSM